MKRVITALITPFKEGKLDEEGLCKNIHFQMKWGVKELLVLGSTGEAESLSEKERLRVIQIARTETRGKLHLWVQTGDSSTYRTIRKTQEAEKLGADGALIVTPYYCCPTQEGLVQHFETIACNTNLPIFIYNHPKRTGTSFDIATLIHLASLENILGLKDASGNVGFVAKLLHHTSNFDIFSGDDLLTLPLLSIGAKGVISVVSNILPQKMCELVQREDKNLYYTLFPFFEFSQCETNPIPIKSIMNRMGMSAGKCRSPLTSLHDKHQKQMQELLSAHV